MNKESINKIASEIVKEAGNSPKETVIKYFVPIVEDVVRKVGFDNESIEMFFKSSKTQDMFRKAIVNEMRRLLNV